MRVSASSLRQIPTVECGFQPLPQKMSGVLVVTNDSVVNAALQNQEKIISVETLDNFIRLDICQKIIKELELEESRESNRSANFQRIISLLTSNKSAKSAVVISMEAELLGEFQGKSIKSFDIPDDNHEATVDRVGNIESLDLYIATVRTILNRQWWNAGFSIITEANTNGGMRVSASASKNVRSIAMEHFQTIRNSQIHISTSIAVAR